MMSISGTCSCASSGADLRAHIFAFTLEISTLKYVCHLKVALTAYCHLSPTCYELFGSLLSTQHVKFEINFTLFMVHMAA